MPPSETRRAKREFAGSEAAHMAPASRSRHVERRGCPYLLDLAALARVKPTEGLDVQDATHHTDVKTLSLGD